MIKLTHKLIHDAARNYCGWNKTQLQLLGVPWPPRKGWLSALIGKEVSEETIARVFAVRGLRPKERRKVLQG